MSVKKWLGVGVLSLALCGCSALEKACLGPIARPAIPVAPVGPGQQPSVFLEK
jgi:hypothetical protein